MAIVIDYTFDDGGYGIQAPDITFVIDSDVTATDLIENFRNFMLAIGYADNSIGEALENTYEEYYADNITT